MLTALSMIFVLKIYANDVVTIMKTELSFVFIELIINSKYTTLHLLYYLWIKSAKFF